MWINLHVHRISAVGIGEAEVALLTTRLTEAECSLARCLRLFDSSLFFLIGEVLLNHVVSLHVDFLVGIGLAVMNLLHAMAFFDKQSISVDAFLSFTSCVLVHLSNLQNVLKTIKSDLDDLVIRASKKIAQGLDATLVDQVADLLWLLETT